MMNQVRSKSAQPALATTIIAAPDERGSDKAKTIPILSCGWQRRGMKLRRAHSRVLGNRRARRRLLTVPATSICSGTSGAGLTLRKTRRRRGRRKRRKWSMRTNTKCAFPAPRVGMGQAGRGIPSPTWPQWRLHRRTSGARKIHDERKGKRSGWLPTTLWP